ncbi:hypothetical protein [uncultured Murdochiella sp.]|uniref:hypothetical protein n=1 Tax=uncultured Murdochiella sp. TaxID=1586095 RepID=UPI002803AFF7|nr:hypothetical protein [uncultured Murdochiella sp.]
MSIRLFYFIAEAGRIVPKRKDGYPSQKHEVKAGRKSTFFRQALNNDRFFV